MTPQVPLTFFFAGFSKCGTTSLKTMLRAHPAIALPAIKEPWFFMNSHFNERWDWFRDLYPADLSRYGAIGDDTNEYTAYQVVNEVAPRIVGLYPGARFLFLARDPATRIESAYRQQHDTGARYGLTCPFDLAEAMRQLPAIYMDANFWYSITPYRALVPPERIKVVHLEDLIDSPAETLASVLSFLGVDPGAEPAGDGPLRLNSGEGKYHDTRLLRRLRANPLVGPALQRLGYERQERILRPLGLRHRYARGQRPEWTPDALAILCNEVLPGVVAFADEYGLPRRGWARLQELTGHSGTTKS